MMCRAAGSPLATVTNFVCIQHPKFAVLTVCEFNPDHVNDEHKPARTFAEHDALVPPSVVARNCQRYSSLAETDFAEFPGRSHLVMLERGWQEIADYVSGWLMRQSVLPSVI